MLVAVFCLSALVLVAFAGLMAAVDAAISVQSRADISELAISSRSRRSLEAIAADPGAHLNAVNFVRIIAETAAAVLVTLAFSMIFAEWWLILIVTALIMAGVSFVLVGASPRSVGRVNAKPVLRFSAPLIHFLRVLLGPIANALVSLGNRVTPLRSRSAVVSSEEQLLSIVDEATELDVLEEGDRELIHSIFEFNETVVREVMVPRTDMVTVDSDADVNEAMGVFLSKGISRIPVLGEGVDQVTGILYLRDVARLVFEHGAGDGTGAVRDVARSATFVPESQKADDLLRQMQSASIHIAMVVDEYGGIAGLVTLEDLIEELVGDISDEYDREAPLFEEVAPGRFRVSARLPVDELGELFDLDLDDEDVDSVGGLFAKALDRLPETGSTVRVAGLLLTADRIEGRRKRLTTVVAERDPRVAAARKVWEDQGRRQVETERAIRNGRTSERERR
jgi:CBS domain containing-hemolysin-like protein